MNKKIFLYLAIFGSISVQAQERWSLRQCIDYAIEHNISIRQTANAAEQSAVEVNTAKWARLPNLNASAGQSWNWGRTQTAIKNEDTGDYSTVYVNTSSHGTNMSVNTSIPIFTGLEIPHQYALAKLNLKAAIADLDKATTLKPEHAGAHELFGDALMQAGKEVEAALQWRLAEEIRKKSSKK